MKSVIRQLCFVNEVGQTTVVFRYCSRSDDGCVSFFSRSEDSCVSLLQSVRRQLCLVTAIDHKTDMFSVL